MVLYMFMPLDRHFDSGFGAVGDVFRDAAKRLQDSKNFGPLFNRRLPICYLLRHAIELFLKSAIIIIHRKYEAPECEQHTAMPEVPLGTGGARPVDRLHSVATLYHHLRSLFQRHDVSLQNIDGSPYRWPSGTDEAIEFVERFDTCSDYFRYPLSRSTSADLLKSSMKEADIKQLAERMKSDPTSVHAFVLVDEDGNPVEAFEHENQAIEQLEENLTCVAGFLCDLHAAMRALLTGGW